MSEELPDQRSSSAEELLPPVIRILNEYKSKVTHRVARIEDSEMLKYAAKFRAAGLTREANRFEEFFNRESSRQRYGGGRGAYIAGVLNEMLSGMDDPVT